MRSTSKPLSVSSFRSAAATAWIISQRIFGPAVRAGAMQSPLPRWVNFDASRRSLSSPDYTHLRTSRCSALTARRARSGRTLQVPKSKQAGRIERHNGTMLSLILLGFAPKLPGEKETKTQDARSVRATRKPSTSGPFVGTMPLLRLAERSPSG